MFSHFLAISNLTNPRSWGWTMYYKVPSTRTGKIAKISHWMNVALTHMHLTTSIKKGSRLSEPSTQVAKRIDRLVLPEVRFLRKRSEPKNDSKACREVVEHAFAFCQLCAFAWSVRSLTIQRKKSNRVDRDLLNVRARWNTKSRFATPRQILKLLFRKSLLSREQWLQTELTTELASLLPPDMVSLRWDGQK